MSRALSPEPLISLAISLLSPYIPGREPETRKRPLPSRPWNAGSVCSRFSVEGFWFRSTRVLGWDTEGGGGGRKSERGRERERERERGGGETERDQLRGRAGLARGFNV